MFKCYAERLAWIYNYLSRLIMLRLIFIPLIFLVSCSSEKQIVREKSAGSYTSCQLVEKPFVKKNGEVADFKELYLRCSIQDYYIKLCESDVTKEDLMPYLNSGITVEMEIKEGNWDICPDELLHIQSRGGTYVVIKSIK